jgi:hypothetical protein
MVAAEDIERQIAILVEVAVEDPKTRSVVRAQDGMMPDATDTAEKLENFLRAEDNRQRLRLPGRRDGVLKGPVFL